MILFTAIVANLNLISSASNSIPLYSGIFKHLAPVAIFSPVTQSQYQHNKTSRPIEVPGHYLDILNHIYGMSPLVFETSIQAQFLVSMAVSLAFGILFATLITLFIASTVIGISERLFYSKKQQQSFAEGT